MLPPYCHAGPGHERRGNGQEATPAAPGVDNCRAALLQNPGMTGPAPGTRTAALSPASQPVLFWNHEFRHHGHTVLVERGAGLGSGITDEEYAIAGAEIVTEADDVWSRADMVMKVKEPVKAEYHRFRKGLILFTYLHLAAEPELTQELINSGVTAIAYETVQEG